MTATPYRGRFAPTPSGPLHQGSLVAALGSWLDARQAQGQWFLRIDDLDQERSRPDAETRIPETLEAHGLTWDGAILLQSTQRERHRAALEDLKKTGAVYVCQCTRKHLSLTPGPYPGHCRHLHLTDDLHHSKRIRVQGPAIEFEDRCFGFQSIELQSSSGDFIVERADGSIAYHLATIIDDETLEITDVVRGGDLLHSTAQQLYLCDQLLIQRRKHAHLPLVINPDGRKLSKQNHAPALSPSTPIDQLHAALTTLSAALKSPLPKRSEFNSVDSLLGWALNVWELQSSLWPSSSLNSFETFEHV